LAERLLPELCFMFDVSMSSPLGLGERQMSTIVLVILVLLVLGALPTWPYSSGWGYYPSSGLGLILVILVVLVVMGRV